MKYNLIIRFHKNIMEDVLTETFKTFKEAFETATSLIDNTVISCTIVHIAHINTYARFDAPQSVAPVQYKYKITTSYIYVDTSVEFKEIVYYYDKEKMLSEYKYLKDGLGTVHNGHDRVISVNYRTLR